MEVPARRRQATPGAIRRSITRACGIPVATLAIALLPSSGAAQGVIRIESGVTATGRATATWLEMLRRRMSSDDSVAAADVTKPLSAEESAWARLIRSRRVTWQGEIARVAAPYSPVSAPDTATVVLGNRGASDAFTHDPRTIGFDLSALQSEYGDAGLPRNADLIDRLFRHEYSHLLQKQWLAMHPYAADTPLRRALLDMWTEGLGNYHSLSSRWRAVGRTPSAAATEALSRLQPRLVARLAALACAAQAHERALVSDLSSGPFDRKWGALPMALWLDQETAVDPDALRSFAAAGPDGVWDLADRHLPEELAAVLREVRIVEADCAGPNP